MHRWRNYFWISASHLEFVSARSVLIDWLIRLSVFFKLKFRGSLSGMREELKIWWTLRVYYMCNVWSNIFEVMHVIKWLNIYKVFKGKEKKSWLNKPSYSCDHYYTYMVCSTILSINKTTQATIFWADDNFNDKFRTDCMVRSSSIFK